MKMLGAIFIIIATTWTGFEAAKRLSERPRQLRQLKVALQSLEAEIMFGHTPLAEACEHLAQQMQIPLKWFFDRFSKRLLKGTSSVKTAWDDSLQEIWNMTAFSQGELEIMKQFGETLGQHDRLQQQKQIRLALTHLEREELDAKARQDKYEKMVKSLGFLSGLLLVILLL